MYASAVLTFLEYIFCVLNVYITEIFKNMTQAQKKPGFEVVEIRKFHLVSTKKYFARYHFRFVIFSLFYLVPIRNA